MVKLSILLCLALFGVCTLADGAWEASRQTLDELQPKFAAAVDEWAKKHRDFDVKVKSIKSGTTFWSNDLGKVYDLVIEDTTSNEWNVHLRQRLDGSLLYPINLSRDGKTNTIFLD